MRKTLSIACAALALLAVAVPATRGDVVVEIDADGLGAMATFGLQADKLVVTLANTGQDALVPTDVLTAVLFSMDGATLVPESGFLGTGSEVLFPGDASSPSKKGKKGKGESTTPVISEVGGEFGFRDDLTGSSRFVISSAGLGDLVGTKDMFPGPNLYDKKGP